MTQLRAALTGLKDAFAKAGYKPSQTRDDKGRWSSDGGSSEKVLPGYETKGHPGYARARAAGYPHARSVWEGQKVENKRRAAQPSVPSPKGRYKLSVHEDGGGAGDYFARYDGSGFDDEMADGKTVTPAQAAKIVNAQPKDNGTYALTRKTSKGDEIFTWSSKRMRWVK